MPDEPQEPKEETSSSQGISRRRLLGGVANYAAGGVGAAALAAASQPAEGEEYIPIEVNPDPPIATPNSTFTIEVVLNAPPPVPVVVNLTYDDPEGVLEDPPTSVTVSPDAVTGSSFFLQVKTGNRKGKTKKIRTKSPKVGETAHVVITASTRGGRKSAGFDVRRSGVRLSR